MSGGNHVAGGTVFTGVFLSMYDINIFSSPAFIFFTALFSLLPDADHTKSIIGKCIYPVAKLINRKYGHRTITHSLLFYIVGYVIVSFIEKATSTGVTISKIYIWAYGSHLIFDMLTKQGIPLFYPFKKNPCVMPANPIYRLKASDLKTEATIFLVFGLIAFSCKNLFANGFWNTYNSQFGNVSHVFQESRKYDGVLNVKYDFVKGNGEGYLIEASSSGLTLFDVKKGFVSINDQHKLKDMKPLRTNIVRTDLQFSFNDISLDSFRKVVSNKIIKELKVQAKLPLSYVKDNEPQTATTVNMQHVFNPIFRSNDIDSIDENIIKDISLIKLQMQENSIAMQLYTVTQAKKVNAFNQVKEDINSTDLAVKEKAIKEYDRLKSQADPSSAPVNTNQALQLRLNYLTAKTHIIKRQSITGFMSYIIFK